MSERRTIKGWAFNKPVHAGAGAKCMPFFRDDGDAIQTANHFAEQRVRVVRATLTLDLIKPKKAKKP